MRDPSEITATQARILEILWESGGSTAAEVRERLRPGDDLARTTVTTMLSRMESYGWVSRLRDGREYRYAPALTRTQVRSAQVGGIIKSLFPSDLPSLVSHALREGDWEPGDLDRIEALIDDYRRTRTSQDGEGRE